MSPQDAQNAALQVRSKRSGDAYSVRYGELPSEKRTSLADSFSILLEKSDEDEVSDTSEESRSWQLHHPSQDHVTHGRPAQGVPAFEKADSDNGGAAHVSGRDRQPERTGDENQGQCR
jgi:hypothetical protein